MNYYILPLWGHHAPTADLFNNTECIVRNKIYVCSTSQPVAHIAEILLCGRQGPIILHMYSISQEICTRFCCALLWFVVVMQSFIMNSHEVFIHIHQGCFAGTGAIVRLPQCQWSKPDGYGKISQCVTTTKHSKAKTVCIFIGIYCNTRLLISRSCKKQEHQQPQYWRGNPRIYCYQQHEG